MIKTLIVLLLASTSAIAQVPCCAQFGGWYAGANIGWAHDDYQFDDVYGLGQAIDSGLPNSVRAEDDGVLGGVQFGYNWQPCCSLLGIEADFSGTSLRPSVTFRDGDFPSADTTRAINRVNFLGTVRGRAGVVVDQLLLYVTGGVAYAHTKQTWKIFEDDPAATETINSKRVRVGGVGGFGAEWAINCSLSIKAEFLYIHFAQHRKQFTSVVHNPGISYRFHSHESQAIGRVGFNYRWGNRLGCC